MVRGARFAVCTTCFVAVYSVTISPYETWTMCMCETHTGSTDCFTANQLLIYQQLIAVEHLGMFGCYNVVFRVFALL